MAFPFFALSKNAWMKPLTYDHADRLDRGAPLGERRRDDLRQGDRALYRQPDGGEARGGRACRVRISSSPRTICSRSPAPTIGALLWPAVGGAGAAAGYADQDQHRSGRGGRGRLLLVAVRGKTALFQTKTGERRLKAVKVRLCDWLFRAILLDRQVLDYAAAYFQLGPIERRIYEVARSTCEEGPDGPGRWRSTSPPSASRSATRTRCRTSGGAEADRRDRRRSPITTSRWSRTRRAEDAGAARARPRAPQNRAVSAASSARRARMLSEHRTIVESAAAEGTNPAGDSRRVRIATRKHELNAVHSYSKARSRARIPTRKHEPGATILLESAKFFELNTRKHEPVSTFTVGSLLQQAGHGRSWAGRTKLMERP